MNSQIKMVIHYEVNENFRHQYKNAISHILSQLPTFEANQIKLSESQNQIIETFLLPTESHYFALKKLRKSKNHSLFGLLDLYIKGGLEQMECYGIKS
ncbi:hypothetical protein [Pseudoneobacillus sp. C159]